MGRKAKLKAAKTQKNTEKHQQYQTEKTPITSIEDSLGPGIICPIKQNGKYVALEIVYDDPQLQTALVKHGNIHPYIDGEEPIAYEAGDNRLIFVGDRIFKPLLVADGTGASVIGAKNFRFLSSIKQIDSLIDTDKHTEFFLAPCGAQIYDGILDEWEKLYTHLKAKGFELKIICFPPDDVRFKRFSQVLSYLEDYSNRGTDVMTWNEFLTMVCPVLFAYSSAQSK